MIFIILPLKKKSEGKMVHLPFFLKTYRIRKYKKKGL